MKYETHSRREITSEILSFVWDFLWWPFGLKWNLIIIGSCVAVVGLIQAVTAMAGHFRQVGSNEQR